MIGPPELNAIRLRAVEGRRIDPFRGTLENEATIHVTRDADTQPVADAIAAVQAMAEVTVEKTGRRLVVTRGDESLKVSFVSAAPRVSVDDLVLDGDGRLALAVMHALLPLFGAVEIRIGRYEDMIDGHEPLAAVVERYDTWFVEDSMRLAKKLHQKAAREADAGEPAFGKRVEPTAAHATTTAAAPGPNAAKAASPPAATASAAPPFGASTLAARKADKTTFTKVALLAVAVFFVIGGGIAIWKHMSKEGIGERCHRNSDCDSNKCLPRQSVEVTNLNGMIIAPRNASVPSDAPGVCTKPCADDSDCPASMTCTELVEVSSIGVFASRAWGCAPRAWHFELPPPVPY